MNQIVRGNLISFAAVFFDGAGNPVTPVSVILTVAYMNFTTAQVVRVPITMTNLSPGQFQATWDSNAAGPGTVYWSVQALAPEGAQEGQFQLLANVSHAA